MAYKGLHDLEYENREEEQHFMRTRRLTGHHSNMVKAIYPEESYKNIMGSNWSKPEALGRGVTGNQGMALRYATIDSQFRKEAVAKGKCTDLEVDEFARAWRTRIDLTHFEPADSLPLSHADILKFWRSNRKDPNKVQDSRRRTKKSRRTKAYEEAFKKDRNPALIYRQLQSALPSTSALDEQLLKQLARLLATGNDLLWQAELIKDAYGAVPTEDLTDFNKLHDIIIKNNRNVLQLLQQHGYDYQSRRKRKEAQTAAEIFEDFVDKATELFDDRAIEFLCPHCQLSLGYFLRHFPTIEYQFVIPSCPRCENKITHTFEALPDEVMTLG